MKRIKIISVLMFIIILVLAGYRIYNRDCFFDVGQLVDWYRDYDEQPDWVEGEYGQPDAGNDWTEGSRAIEELNGLVRIQDVDDSIVVELRYATENNFTGRKIYPAEVCLLTRGTAEKLAAANGEFQKKGYRIKIWDAYRPLHVQQVLWDAASNKLYVANPKKGSKHNRGSAVDITLVDTEGKELEMPTGFDEFSIKASRNYRGMSEEARKNLDYLTEVMTRNGFKAISGEWWHYDDADWADYPLLDVPLEEFEG